LLPNEERSKRKTEVIYGSDATKQWMKYDMQNIKNKMDIISDYTGLLAINENQACKSEYVDIKHRGGTIRLVTGITKDNIDYCRELMNTADELRHLEGIKGTIGISENECVSTTVLRGSQPTVQLIYSDTFEVVEQGQYIFDMLWTVAIPYTQRVRQIEDDDKLEYDHQDMVIT
jgi:two-component system sensor histidine kinase VicK